MRRMMALMAETRIATTIAHATVLPTRSLKLSMARLILRSASIGVSP